MAQPITVVTKKKPMAFKPTGSGDAPEAAVAEPVFLMAEQEPSYMVGGVCAIIATLCLIAVLVLQWLEVEYLRDAMTTAVTIFGL